MPHQGQAGVYFNSDGHRLLGTLFLARGDAPKPTAVILHGIPGIEKNYDLALALRDSGWNSLIFHYRGSWGSEGRYVLQTIPEDVRAALDDLGTGRYPQVDPHRLVLVGHSLSGWAAVLSAVADPRVRALAVEQVARLAPRPLLVVHGGADEAVPVAQAEALFARADEPRKLVIHPEANHSFTWHRPWLRDQILGWLECLDLSNNP